MQIKNMLASILFFFIGFVSMAQIPTPPPPDAPSGPPVPVGFPIDNGIVILFVLALAYGSYVACKSANKSA